ncbi:hypothetical protein LCGC14_1524080 [marine sediment metagenome]|uniref:LamG-like jellyroll fold domain-containing protein n=1 Tax=marine sediment metagenome TaxID=412755 RepID=A0A0F9LD93_9ZZZZ
MRTIHKAMGLMLFAIILGVLFGSSVSAFEFDNREYYDQETDTYTIKDSLFGFPTTRVSEISRLDQGRNGAKEFWFVLNYTLYEDNYKNPFSSIRLKKIVNGQWIQGENVDFELFVKQGTKTIEKDTFTENCVQDLKNVSNQICETVKSGTKQVIEDNYVPLDQTKLRKGNYEIKIQLKKGIFDDVDWIARVNGRELLEWTFLGNLVAFYYNFEDASTTVAVNVDNTTFRNGTLISGTDSFGLPIKSTNNGFIAQGVNFTGNFNSETGNFIHTFFNSSVHPDDNLTEFSWSFWLNISRTDQEQKIMGHPDIPSNSRFFEVDSGNYGFFVDTVSATTSARSTGNWHLIVLTAEVGDTIKIFVDNDNEANATFSAGFFANYSHNFTLNGFGVAPGQFFNGSLDEFGYWGVALTPDDVNDLWNGGSGLAFAGDEPSTLSMVLDTPADGLNTIITSLNLSTTLTPTNLNLTNATLMVYNTTTNLFNETTNTVLGTAVNFSNYSLFSLPQGTYIWNVFGCGVNNTGTVCNIASSNRTFTIGTEVFENSSSNFTYETAQERFVANVSIPESDTISSVELIYNGTAHSATSTLISGSNYTLDSTIDIPLTAVPTADWFWQIHFDGGFVTNTSANAQPVGAINLSLLGQGIGGLTYINFTFQNETTAQETVSATFSSTWSYFLGSGTINRTLSFTNASENFNYSFQFHPQNRTLSADLSVDYGNGESQLRSFNPALLSLTNVTSLQTLLLLPTVDGIFQQFVTQTAIGATVPDVTFVINRTIGGTPTEISSGTTDSSGFASIFLNPDFSYQAIFSKVTFGDNSFTFQPSNQLRTVIMGGVATAVSNGSIVSVNTTYEIRPTNGSLSNSTSFIFSFNVTSSQPINSIIMNITNASGFQVGFQSDTSTGFISQTINTGENRSFVGTFQYATANETVTVKKVWIIGTEFVGDYSIFRQFSLYTTYGFRDFIRFMLALAMIGGVLIFMTSGETFDTSESKIAVSLLLIWAFSIVGWLTIPGPPTISANATITALAQFGNQYGIAILSSGAGVFFIGRRVFT